MIEKPFGKVQEFILCLALTYLGGGGAIMAPPVVF